MSPHTARMPGALVDRSPGLRQVAAPKHFPFNEHRLFERFATGYMQALVD